MTKHYYIWDRLSHLCLQQLRRACLLPTCSLGLFCCPCRSLQIGRKLVLAALPPAPSPLVSLFLASLHWCSSVTGAVVLGSHRVAMDTATVGRYCIWWPFHHHKPTPSSSVHEFYCFYFISGLFRFISIITRSPELAV